MTIHSTIPSFHIFLKLRGIKFVYISEKEIMKARKTPRIPINWSTEWKMETAFDRKRNFKSFDEALKTRGINHPLEGCMVMKSVLR